MKKDKLNPELMVGDEIMVLDNNQPKGASFNPPKLYTPYVVVGIKHQQRQNWQGPDTDTAYYQIEPVDITDDELLGGLLAGGGRRRLTHLYTNDKWTLRKGFLRGGINEHNQPGLNPELKVGDIVRVIDVDGEHARMPERFGVYKVVKVGNAHPLMTKRNRGHDTYYDIVPYPEPEISDIFSLSDTLKMSPIKTLYRGDTWIYGDTPTANKVDRLTINEQGFSWDGTYANEIDEGNGADTSWSNDEEKITLQDILELTKNIEVINFPTKELSKVVLNWDDNPEEIERISQVEVSQQYPILIMVNEDNKILWVLDGNHRAQKALMNNIDSIPAKLIKPSDLDERTIKMFFPKGIPGTNQTISEQEEPETDDYSDEEIDKRKTYDSDDENETGDGKPFTPIEVKILNTLHKYLTRSDLQTLSQEVPSPHGGIGSKFWGVMKLFGLGPGNTAEDTRTTKYAKWASDNWTLEGDYGNIENPLKVPLKWYDVDREETGSQVEYKSGNAEVLGFDEDDAGERADYDFYAWDGEMHTNDYGDYEQYDSEITNSVFLRMDESTEDYKSDPKVREMLFNYWVEHGPSLDPNNMKLLGYNMSNYDDRSVVWDNLKEYYGDEELNDIIYERLEGLHDSWSYEYIVTNAEWNGGDITLDILVNGDTQIPVTQESGGAIDMSLWDINENETGDYQNDDIYDEVRDSISSDIEEVLLKDLPVVMNLDYMDLSKPGTFESYVKENELEIIREEDDGYIDDMVYIDEPREKHIRRMDKDLGSLEGFPIENFKNVPPPTNESSKTEEEIGYLEDIPVDKNLVNSADEIRNHFSKFLSTKGLKYPKEELKPVMRGVTAIILKLKYHYNRPRPWQIAQEKGLELNAETLQSSSSPSYPSGHATQGRFIARYLANLYPEYVDELTQIGDDIAFSRNMAKVHYPSDSAFGKLLGDSMYDYVYQPQEELELQVNEQVMVDKGDMLKSDIFRILSNTFILTPTDHSEIKDSEGNYYGIYDIKQEEYVNMSDLIEGVLDFMVYGVESGDFKEEDIEKGVSAITDWVSLMMNQKKDLVN